MSSNKDNLYKFAASIRKEIKNYHAEIRSAWHFCHAAIVKDEVVDIFLPLDLIATAETTDEIYELERARYKEWTAKNKNYVILAGYTKCNIFSVNIPFLLS